MVRTVFTYHSINHFVFREIKSRRPEQIGHSCRRNWKSIF